MKLTTLFMFVAIFSIHISGVAQSITDTARRPVATRTPATVLITDNEQHPLQGASVTLKNAKFSGITDANGRVSLNVNVGDVIQVTFIGFAPAQYTVTAQQPVYPIALQRVNNKLNETVVVGYGSQKAGDVTGSISTIGQKDIEKRAIGNASFDRALGGMVKGLLVTENNGIPGASASINIRGFTSPFSGGTNQPLFVIDGVILNTDASFNTGVETMDSRQSNPLLAIDPNNIDNISILRDAAATAIYGSRGANGVIIVTTKKGKKGEKPVATLSYMHSIGQPIGQVKPMNTQQYIAYTDLMIGNTVSAVNNGELNSSFLENLINTGVADITQDPATEQYAYHGLIPSYFGTADVNWFNEIYRKNAVTRQANFNVHGGTDATTYSMGASLLDQEGVMINSGIRRYGFNINMNTALNKYISTGATINLSSTRETSGITDFSSADLLPARPDVAVYDENGQLQRQPGILPMPGYLTANPVAKLKNRDISKANNIAGNAFVSAEPVKNLRLKAAFNLGLFQTNTDAFNPQVAQDLYPDQDFIDESRLSVSNTTFTNYITEVSAEYNLQLPGAHRINFTTGYIWDRTTVSRGINTYGGFPDDEILNNVNNARTNYTYGGGRAETGLNSIFGRANYNYEDRFLATINFRSDASSKFGPGNKRGYFPSLSAGWNISNENFFGKGGIVERLKLRLSAGKTGSSNVDDFAYLQFFERDFTRYRNQPAVIFSGTLPNLGISWETTYDYNAGIDFDLKNQWLTGTVDIYYRSTPNSIAPTPFPVELGASEFTSNLVHMTNKGIEIELNANILQRPGGFRWSANINWALNRNKIKSLNNAPVASYLQDYFIEGQPAGTIKGYQATGIFQTQAEVDALNAAASAKYGTGTYYDQRGTAPGDYRFADLNGDGRVTLEDRIILGNIEPDYFGGIGNTFSYKGFELTAFFQFVTGNKARWASNSTFELLQNQREIYANNTWTVKNPAAEYPRVVYSDPGANYRINDRDIFDASYLRLKTLYLNYRFNNKFTQRLKLTDLTLFASVANVFTISRWPGPDPGSVSPGISARSLNTDPYPLSRSASFGLNVQF